ATQACLFTPSIHTKTSQTSFRPWEDQTHILFIPQSKPSPSPWLKEHSLQPPEEKPKAPTKEGPVAQPHRARPKTPIPQSSEEALGDCSEKGPKLRITIRQRRTKSLRMPNCMGAEPLMRQDLEIKATRLKYTVIYRVRLQYLHPKDGVYPEKDEPCRQGVESPSEELSSLGKPKSIDYGEMQND
ncbi:hypothetical protein CUMW_283530, partial [Citrus unshiu]